MVKEIAENFSSGSLYISPRLSLRGVQDYPNLLLKAAKDRDEVWLANELRLNRRINAQEKRRKPKGGYTLVSVPVTAPETLSEGEFNRIYICALCRLAIETGVNVLLAYRAKPVASPRYESEQKIGTPYNPTSILADLRAHVGIDTALGIPAGPNSGLSVKLP